MSHALMSSETAVKPMDYTLDDPGLVQIMIETDLMVRAVTGKSISFYPKTIANYVLIWLFVKSAQGRKELLSDPEIRQKLKLKKDMSDTELTQLTDSSLRLSKPGYIMGNQAWRELYKTFIKKPSYTPEKAKTLNLIWEPLKSDFDFMFIQSGVTIEQDDGSVDEAVKDDLTTEAGQFSNLWKQLLFLLKLHKTSVQSQASTLEAFSWGRSYTQTFVNKRKMWFAKHETLPLDLIKFLVYNN